MQGDFFLSKTIEPGKIEQQLTIDFLEKQGYKILFSNWRNVRCDIYIIASKELRVHFIEFKRPKPTPFGRLNEKVSKRKVKNLMLAADDFLNQYPLWDDIQFDIVVIGPSREQPNIYFREDVYL